MTGHTEVTEWYNQKCYEDYQMNAFCYCSRHCGNPHNKIQTINIMNCSVQSPAYGLTYLV